MSANKNRNLALNMLALVVGMFLLCYASVPLYRMFCQMTGFGGTTQDVSAQKPLPTQAYDREMTVFFNADVMPELPWKFAPLQRKVSVKVGEQKLVFFRVTNEGTEPLEGVSTFNVAPDDMGQYFVKVKCFCYEKQRIQPGQTIDMPVSFFIDPSLLENDDLDKLTSVTLSYTFFKTLPKE
jgi:cytochrome c oxidase assembly protein subunit 11